MKKVISLLLSVIVLLGCFSGCSPQEPTENVQEEVWYYINTDYYGTIRYTCTTVTVSSSRAEELTRQQLEKFGMPTD